MKNILETSTYTQAPFPLPCLSAVKCIYVICRGPKEKISEVQKEIKHSYAAKSGLRVLHECVTSLFCGPDLKSVM